MTNENRTVDDINMSEAPETSSFMLNARLVTEEWTYQSLEKRTRNGYIKPDVPYYHVAWQPLTYTISDGGVEGDGLEHTWASIKNSQGELTPKGSARDELVKAFEARGFPRKTVKDLTDNSAVGKVFKVKRYNRSYKRGTETVPGELMLVPVDLLPDDWAPAPGVALPDYPRKPRRRDGEGGGSAVPSGSVVRSIGPSAEKVADALVGTAFTEMAARGFILDHTELAQGEFVDLALSQKLLENLEGKGLIKDDGGKVARA